MPSAIGFYTNASAVNSIGTTYDVTKPIALTYAAGTSGAELPMPQGAYLDHVELRGTATGAITTLNVRLTWDVTGDQPITNEYAITPLAGLTTSALVGGVAAVGMWVRPPTSTLTIYAWAKVNANAISFAAGGVRLHWAEAFAGRP